MRERSRSTRSVGSNVGGGAFISSGTMRRRWGSRVWPDTHLNYMIDIALTAEFRLAVGGVR
jgi:hypothetical protein